MFEFFLLCFFLFVVFNGLIRAGLDNNSGAEGASRHAASLDGADYSNDDYSDDDYSENWARYEENETGPTIKKDGWSLQIKDRSNVNPAPMFENGPPLVQDMNRKRRRLFSSKKSPTLGERGPSGLTLGKLIIPAIVLIIGLDMVGVF